MRVLPRENPVDGVVLVVELVDVPDPKPNPEQFDQMRHSTLYGRYLPLPVTTNPRPGTRRRKVGEVSSSVVDPKLFIPDPAQALNFPSSGSGSRQKFRIHADPDPTCII